MAKGTKTGGRKKGTRNKNSVIIEEMAIKLGVSPFEVLLRFADGDWKGLGYENECYFSEKPDGAVKMGYVITPESRLKAAESAAKYLYPQKQAITHSVDGDSGIKVVVEDYSKE